MRRGLRFGLALLVAGWIPVFAGDSGRGRSRTETSPVFWLSDFSQVRHATAEMNRHKMGIFWLMKTRELTPGDAITVWFCGWNDPTECVNGPGTCGSDPADLEDTVPGSFCWWGNGGIVSNQGEVVIGGVARVNQPPGEKLFGELTRPRKAEINLVVKTHGAPIPDQLLEQITTFDGGCAVNQCEELQIAVFTAH